MMDKSEIIISFRSAKDKERQIKVLSDLNCVSPREIADILDEAGELKKVGLNAKTFPSVYHAVPPAKAPQMEEPKATRKRSGSVPPLDEIRAMELFNEGLDDLTIGEALGVSWYRIQQWRYRMGLYRTQNGAAKNKKQSKEESMKKNVTQWAPDPQYALPTPPKNLTEASPKQKPLTANGFLTLLGKLVAPVLDAEISIDGSPVTDIYGYEVVVESDHLYVNVRTRKG